MMDSGELKAKVEEYLEKQIPDSEWPATENYARKKLAAANEREGNIYGDAYLVLLVADTWRESREWGRSE